MLFKTDGFQWEELEDVNNGLDECHSVAEAFFYPGRKQTVTMLGNKELGKTEMLESNLHSKTS